MKKYKVVLVELSQKKEDGSRDTLKQTEVCSCKRRGDAELILYLLRNQSSYKTLCNQDKAKPTERMFFLAVV